MSVCRFVSLTACHNVQEKLESYTSKFLLDPFFKARMKETRRIADEELIDEESTKLLQCCLDNVKKVITHIME